MLLLILKSSACLAVFMLFYKLCLEKTSAHTFKRFYLIGATLISIAIPFIAFTVYVEVESVNLGLEPQDYSNLEITDITEPKNYLLTILWSIYALGAILFSIRFFKNLHQLFKKIKDNPKYKNQYFINVLITDLITPHTFFNYIFLNKTKFENNLIPNEVLLHEQTHAKQMHALDLLFIEVLQILFWFNPLLYFIKKDMKLNHEFLADQAVIKHGIDSSIYQKTLLAFSSPDSYREASDSSLVNAINYSSIKKRFAIMKTKTSKAVLWFRSLIILPLLAILIYSFSEKLKVEKERNEITHEVSEIRIFIDKDKAVLINNKLVNFQNISNKIIELKNNIIKENSVEPKLFIEVDNHVTDEYFIEIINEIKKTKLKVVEFKSNSLLLDKEKSKHYSKGITLTANYIVFENDKGEMMEGISIPKNTTYIENENLKSLLNFLKEKEANFAQALTKEKTEKNKIEIAQQINFLGTRISMVENKLNHSIKSPNQNKKNSQTKESITINIPKNSGIINSNDISKIDNYVKNLIKSKQQITAFKNKLTIKIIHNETIFINDEKCDLDNLNNRLTDLIEELTLKEKEELVPTILHNSPDGDKTYEMIRDILRKHGVLRVNKNMNISYEHDTIYVSEQKATHKELEEYNTLAKKIKANPEGVFKAKDINRVILLYNEMSLEQKKTVEPFPKFTPPPPIPENATPEQRKNYLNNYLRYKKLTKRREQVNDSISPSIDKK